MTQFATTRNIRRATAALAMTFLTTSAFAQNGLPLDIPAPPGSVAFGASIDTGGDVNGDGFDDLIITDPLWVNDNGVTVGRWYLISGADGSLFWPGDGVNPNNGEAAFVQPVDFIGDINEDGFDDFILGRPGDNQGYGRVEVISGEDGSLLAEYVGEVVEQKLGYGAAGIGNYYRQYQSEEPEYAYITSFGADRRDYVYIHRGGDHEFVAVSAGYPARYIAGTQHRIWDQREDRWFDGFDLGVGTWPGDDRTLRITSEDEAYQQGGLPYLELPAPHPETDLDFSYSLAGWRDLTGDGFNDMAVTGALGSHVYTFTGRYPGLFTTIQNPRDVSPGYFGYELELADLNGDGLGEVIIADLDAIYAFDAPTGRLIFWTPFDAVVKDGEAPPGYGLSIGDVNGDGIDDLAFATKTEDGSTAVRVTAGSPFLLSPTSLDSGAEIRRGEIASITMTGALPDRPVRLLASVTGTDCTFIPRLDICIDLSEPIIQVMRATPDANGDVIFDFAVPANAPLGNVWFQAFDHDHWWMGPVTSNVLQLEIVE